MPDADWLILPDHAIERLCLPAVIGRTKVNVAVCPAGSSWTFAVMRPSILTLRMLRSAALTVIVRVGLATVMATLPLPLNVNLVASGSIISS